MPSMRSRIAGAVAFAAAITPAAAQDWPVRPVSMVVPFAAGSASDTVARILGARLSELLAQQVLVENIGGAGGMTGVSRVAKAAPDGYQFVLGGIDTFAQNQTLYKKPLYNSVTDFVPVALMVEQPLVLVARNDLPVGN
jgi:tripartite-type tricarboxylate transporter receptor subunit TctC